VTSAIAAVYIAVLELDVRVFKRSSETTRLQVETLRTFCLVNEVFAAPAAPFESNPGYPLDPAEV
jgi:hypothetical protein